MDQSEKALQNPYLKSISLQNIKCFGPKQTLKLAHRGKPYMWTMILGDNGTGKSTILKMIAATLGKPKDDLHRINDESYVKQGQTSGIVELKMLDPDLPKIGGRKQIDVSAGWEFQIIRPSLLEFKVPAFGYGSYRRYKKAGLSQSEDRPFSTLFNEEASLINAEDWLLRTDYRSIKGKQGVNSELESVKSILRKILGDEVRDIEISEMTDYYGVRFLTRYGWVSLSQLSSGYKSLVTWMVDLAAKLYRFYPSSPDVLKEPAVVLVDEIDLHLHVSLQKSIVHFLRSTFPKIQFIVTAHSPLMVFGEEDANLIILEKEADHVIIQESHDNVNNWRVDQVLTSELFGLETARSEAAENVMERRVDLLRLEKRNSQQEKELRRLTQEVNKMPSYETEELNEAHAIILKAAAALKKEGRDD